MKIIKHLSCLVLMLSMGLSAYAQGSDDYESSDEFYCPKILQTLKSGTKDSQTTPTGQVTELQTFLVDYYDLDSKLITGSFGRITRTNVIKFQKENGLPTLGTVGAMTRAKINEVCKRGGSVQTTTQVVTPIVVKPSIPQQNSNPVTCNGKNYTPCSAGQVFRCLTSGGQCGNTNDNYCNGTYTTTCSAGQTFSCTSSGGTCLTVQNLNQSASGGGGGGTITSPVPSANDKQNNFFINTDFGDCPAGKVFFGKLLTTGTSGINIPQSQFAGPHCGESDEVVCNYKGNRTFYKKTDCPTKTTNFGVWPQYTTCNLDGSGAYCDTRG